MSLGVSVSRRFLKPIPRYSTSLISPSRSFSNISKSPVSNEPSLPWNTVVKFVPHQEAWIIERFGKYTRTLFSGLQVLYPFIEKVKYVHSLKEVVVEIPSQSAITMDNVSLDLDGLLYYRVVDGYKASYCIDRPHYAIMQLAMTTLRSEIGQLTLDRTLAERTQLNTKIVTAINLASKDWGIHCVRYEIREMHLPSSVRQSMHSQVAAERSKRAAILEAEGQRQSAIYLAQGQKEAKVLQSEGEATEILNQANAKAKSVLIAATANASKLKIIGNGMKSQTPAVHLQITETWLESWKHLSKHGNMFVVQAPLSDPISMVTSGSMIWKKLTEQNPMSIENIPNPPPESTSAATKKDSDQ